HREVAYCDRGRRSRLADHRKRRSRSLRSKTWAVRVGFQVFRQVPASDIPDGRCRVMRLEQMVGDVILSNCSRLAEQRIGLRNAAAYLKGTGPVENRQRITRVRQVFAIVVLVRLVQVPARKGVEAFLADAVGTMPSVDVGKGARRIQK